MHQFCEATGWNRLPGELWNLPLSEYRRWWDYIATRGDNEELENPAIWQLHEPIVEMLKAIYGDD